MSNPWAEGGYRDHENRDAAEDAQGRADSHGHPPATHDTNDRLEHGREQAGESTLAARRYSCFPTPPAMASSSTAGSMTRSMMP